VISNGIPPGFAPAPLERPARHRGKLLVLAVGRLAREKRLDVTLEGVRRSRHADRIQLVVTGRGPEEAEVRRLAATLPLPAEVGFVSEGELRRLLATADLLVHSSEVELEGMAVLEALACGTPALVARAPGSAAQQFALSDDFLFEPGDPDDLARRLDLLVEAPERLRESRAQALALAGRHRLEDSVRQLEALYLRVAGRRSAVPG
jgi:glycosyltransferase involved in cell wall biosynthesis